MRKAGTIYKIRKADLSLLCIRITEPSRLNVPRPAQRTPVNGRIAVPALPLSKGINYAEMTK
jgi:hypothetical protein